VFGMQFMFDFPDALRQLFIELSRKLGRPPG
jgi:hypothetical protein